MKLKLNLSSNDWDHALLAAVVNEAHKVASAHDNFVGRTSIQKIMYFLKALGVPMSYDFEMHHYGPFSSSILRDMEWLIADDVIADLSKEPQEYSNYAPGEGLKQLLSDHQKGLKQHNERICKLAKALAPLKPEQLELIATLDYLLRWEKATGGSGPWKPRVVDRFMEVKKEKFSRKRVEDAYDVMKNAGFLAE
ncbi:MAG TPA: hypothetical protein VFJ58_16915 [Armatimonadota bacterium]|nr:hypothetical protein [Armatimonadota bacterium]